MAVNNAQEWGKGLKISNKELKEILNKEVMAIANYDREHEKERKNEWKFYYDGWHERERKTERHYYWVYLPNESGKIAKYYTEAEAENKAISSGRKVERVGGDVNVQKGRVFFKR